MVVAVLAVTAGVLVVTPGVLVTTADPLVDAVGAFVLATGVLVVSLATGVLDESVVEQVTKRLFWLSNGENMVWGKTFSEWK